MISIPAPCVHVLRHPQSKSGHLFAQSNGVSCRSSANSLSFILRIRSIFFTSILLSKMLTYSYSLSASWTFNTFFPFIPVYLISFQIIIVKLQYCSTVIACYSALLAILNYFHHLFHLKILILLINTQSIPVPIVPRLYLQQAYPTSTSQTIPGRSSQN